MHCGSVQSTLVIPGMSHMAEKNEGFNRRRRRRRRRRDRKPSSLLHDVEGLISPV
jgi:hypothetical protein